MLSGFFSNSHCISSSHLIRYTSTIIIRVLVVLALIFSTAGRLHNFASLDVLSDGEVERYIHYQGLTVKETQVNSSDNRESLLLRQMTDGKTFIQLIYTTHNKIRDCEHLKSKALVRQFLRSFRHSIHARRMSSSITSLDGQPLPPYYTPWFSMHKLKHRCNKLHKAVKKMSKRVPNIYDNLIDVPDQHFDWKYISKHKHMRNNTTVPEYLLELPSTTSRIHVPQHSTEHKPSMFTTTTVLYTPESTKPSIDHNTTKGKNKQPAAKNNSSTNIISVHKANIDKNKPSNQTSKCRRRNKHKCSKKIHGKDVLTTKNISNKSLIKGQHNNLVTNLHEIHLKEQHTKGDDRLVQTTSKQSSIMNASNETNTIQNNVLGKSSSNSTRNTNRKNFFLNFSKLNEGVHHPENSLDNTKLITTAVTVSTSRANTSTENTISVNKTTSSIHNVKIRHHHKQNRHFKKKKRKKNGQKKLKQGTKDMNNVNNESTNKPSSEFQGSLNKHHVHGNHSQLEISTPVTNASNTHSNNVRLSNNVLNGNKTDSISFNDLTEESSEHNVNAIKHVRRIGDASNKTRLRQESMHVYRNLTAEENMSVMERLQLGLSNLMLLPGTKWCGNGNGATGFSDLGSFSQTDLCCRRHDSCRYTIPGFGRKWGYFNFKPFTLSYCGCDHRFRTCLKLTDSGSANLVGKLFFNVVQTKCFVLRQERLCTRHSWWGKCLGYEATQRAEIRDNHPY